MENIRLLTLCSLGAEVEELSYELAARELQVGEDEVEYWVVLAIKRKMMDARMDQLHRVIKIRCAAPLCMHACDCLSVCLQAHRG